MPVRRSLDDARGVKHRTYRRHGPVQFIVDHDIVELAPVADLVARQLHAAGDFHRIVARSVAQPVFQCGQRRRQDEHADQIVRQSRSQLAVTLPIDVEHHVLAGP